MNGPKVGSAALVKSGYMLGTLSIPRYVADVSARDNALGADNQQERLIGRQSRDDLIRILRDHTPDTRPGG
jgi:hypothetical protein